MPPSMLTRTWREVWLVAAVALLTAVTLPSSSAGERLHDALHAPFDQVLKAHVKDGFVDYPAIASNSSFDRYLRWLSEAQFSDEEPLKNRLAFWINAYNALAIKGILDGYSPSTLIGRYRYFKSVEYQVARRRLNLYDLEREVLIALGDSRIHFAIVCASASCPPLRSETYKAATLEEQLDEQARQFLNDTSKNRFESLEMRAHLSKIFDWYAAEFARH